MWNTSDNQRRTFRKQYLKKISMVFHTTNSSFKSSMYYLHSVENVTYKMISQETTGPIKIIVLEYCALHIVGILVSLIHYTITQ